MNAENPLFQQIEMARSLVRLVARTDAAAASFVSCAIAGAGGLGKTHLVKTTLAEVGVRHRIVRGTLAAMIQDVYAFRDGGVLVLDDADNLVLGGGQTMNFMKQLLYPSARREIVHDTIAARRNEQKMDSNPSIAPPRFEVRCGVIWLTNLDIRNPKHIPAKIAAHIQPLVDRGLKPVRLSDDPRHILDYVLWLATECELLKRMGTSLIEANDALRYFVEHAWRFPSLSIRTLENCAATRKAAPTMWQALLDAELLPQPRFDYTLPEIPVLVPRSQTALAA